VKMMIIPRVLAKYDALVLVGEAALARQALAGRNPLVRAQHLQAAKAEDANRVVQATARFQHVIHDDAVGAQLQQRDGEAFEAGLQVARNERGRLGFLSEGAHAPQRLLQLEDGGARLPRRHFASAVEIGHHRAQALAGRGEEEEPLLACQLPKGQGDGVLGQIVQDHGHGRWAGCCVCMLEVLILIPLFGFVSFCGFAFVSFCGFAFVSFCGVVCLTSSSRSRERIILQLLETRRFYNGSRFHQNLGLRPRTAARNSPIFQPFAIFSKFWVRDRSPRFKEENPNAKKQTQLVRHGLPRRHARARG
jgi:hypothetical protein